MHVKQPPKKVLIVDNSSWNIYNFRLPHILKLKANGYTVLVATPIDEYIGKLDSRSYDKHIPLRHLFPQNKNIIQDLFLLWELYRIYKNYSPDLVVHFTIKPNIYGSLIARLCKIKSVSVVTGLGYTFLHPNGLNRIVPLLYKLAFRKINRLVVYNSDDRKVLVEKKIIPIEKCTIIPGSGVNTNHFRPLPSPSDHGKFVFLFIGRLLKDKGILEFVEAAKNLTERNKNIECWVIGNFTYTNPSAVSKDQLYGWVKEGHIKYFGFAEDVRSYLKHADVMVLPSHRGEGVPRSILESMSMGKPIITTKTAGCKDTVVHGSNGLLVPVGNSKALLMAMTTMVEIDTKELVKMGQASRDLVVRYFDEKRIASDFFTIVNDILPVQNYEYARTGSQAVFQQDSR